MKKRIQFSGVILFFALCSGLVGYGQEPVRVMVNNMFCDFSQPPVVENGRTLVPMRSIFEALGAEVSWEEDTQTVTAEGSGHKVELQIDQTTARRDGQEISLEVPAKIINGSTVVPVRFIAESMDCRVDWQEKTRCVIITSGDEVAVRDLGVDFIDVGQADAIYIALPNGEDMLIDAGNNKDGQTVVTYLKEHGVEMLDYLVGTHPHADHIGGMDTVIDAFDIENIYMPDASTTTKTFEDVLSVIGRKGYGITRARAGAVVFERNGLKLEFLSPVQDWYKDLNDYSAVVRLTYLNKTFLFMGDAGMLPEQEITGDVEADVLKIGHHGSKTATSQEFLNRVRPAYAVVCVGAGNSYGHPAQEVLDRLYNAQVWVYRTDVDGTVCFESDGNSLEKTAA